MALFEAQLLNIRAVEAGNAAEMETRLNAALAAALAAGELAVADLQLAAAGGGPQWMAWFPTATDTGVISGASLPLSPPPIVVAVVAGNPAEATLRLKQKLSAALPGEVYKVVVAGAGLGPTYMALAIAAPGG